MSKKILALAFSLFIVTMPTYAANWISVGIGARGDEFFVDKSSLQRDGDSVTYWYRTNYKERTAQQVLSTKLQATINCRRREKIERFFIAYDDIDNRGHLIDSFDTKSRSKWEPIPPESMYWRMMQLVCRK